MFLLLCIRWVLKTGQFAAPIAAGLAIIWVVLWFAAWWPPVFGLEGAAYFLAAFFTSWTLVPILWVSEFARIVRLIDGYAEATLVLLDRKIAHRRWIQG